VWGERLSGQDRVTVHLGVTRASVRVYGPTNWRRAFPNTDQCQFARTYARRLSNCHRDFTYQAMREPSLSPLAWCHFPSYGRLPNRLARILPNRSRPLLPYFRSGNPRSAASRSYSARRS
jgi:hypothetical protein